MRIRRFVLGLAVAALMLSVTACGSNSGSSSGNTIRLEVLKSGLATVLDGIATKVNAYQHEGGVKVEVVGVTSGDSNVAVQELVQGRVDAAFVNSESVATLESAYVAKGQSAPLKVVAATTNVSNLVLSSKINYTGLNSLRGLTLGVSALTSIHRTNFDYYLSTQNTSEDQLGIKFVAVGSSDMPSALASDQIDGFLHSEPTTTIAITKDNAQLAMTIGGEVRDTVANVIAVRTDYLKSHGPLVKKLVDALQYATTQFQSMSESDVVDIYASYTNSPTDLMTQVYEQKDHYNPGLVPLRPAADAYWKIGIPAMKARNLVTDALTENDMFDFSYS